MAAIFIQSLERIRLGGETKFVSVSENKYISAFEAAERNFYQTDL